MFSSEDGARDRLIPRWIVLRALGLIYFSAFFSLVFQIRGLIGPRGILPAQGYLDAVAHHFGPGMRLWFAPTLLWLSSSDRAVMALCWIGLAASLLAVLNLWPRAALAVCFLCFLSFVAAAQEFSGYQSDGMLLEMGFLALFFVPPGLRPGWGRAHPPSRASLFLLQWEWFRIYFESGLVKLLSGDQQWRNFTAMDQYYQNGPLPTWVGWYVEHFPHWFHAATVVATLAMELGIVWVLFLPRRWRIICFLIVTPWELGVILTANYTFLNYLVLTLGFLLLDDRILLRWLPFLRKSFAAGPAPDSARALDEKPLPSLAAEPDSVAPAAPADESSASPATMQADGEASGGENADPNPPPSPAPSFAAARMARRWLSRTGLVVNAICITWVFYATTAELVRLCFPEAPVPMEPAAILEPFRIANQYGLFAVMTRGRYEIEFQGSNDGETWIPYPFRFKPQGLNVAPGIYAPYQPRFDWNLWFASLGGWEQNSIVPRTEVKLLNNDSDVLALFAGNPFPGAPPKQVRAVLWRYWFTTREQKHATGDWWTRELLGLYAPTLEREPDGRVGIVAVPQELPEHD
jgi:hypothetical protein